MSVTSIKKWNVRKVAIGIQQKPICQDLNHWVEVTFENKMLVKLIETGSKHDRNHNRWRMLKVK